MDALATLNPDRATLVSGQVVSAESVQVGTVLAVQEGEQFPLDGTLVEGASTMADESVLTGESKPVRKTAGQQVWAGTVNVGSYVEMVATAKHEDSSASKIIHLIQSYSDRAPTEQLVERAAAIYTPLVFIAAIGLATIPWAVGDRGPELTRAALVLLVVACPCALVISTPISYVCGLANAAKNGIMIKGGRHLESLGQVKHVCLDKTGTLTHGRFAAQHLEVLDDPGVSQPRALALLVAVQRAASHPLSIALAAAAEPRLGPEGAQVLRGLKVSSCNAIPSEGITAKVSGLGESRQTVMAGNMKLAERMRWTNSHPAWARKVNEWAELGLTSGWLGTEVDGPLVVFAVGDEPRPEAAHAVASLHALSIETHMLTGDNPPVAQAVGAQVGVVDIHAGLLPEDKARYVDSLPKAAMVGDGVNDGPALAAAMVSVALAEIGSAVALDTADVALMRDDLRALPAAIKLGRRTLTKIRQNLTFSVVSKAAILSVTMTVYPSLWLAIAVDVGGMLLVTANAMLLLN